MTTGVIQDSSLGTRLQQSSMETDLLLTSARYGPVVHKRSKSLPPLHTLNSGHRFKSATGADYIAPERQYARIPDLGSCMQRAPSAVSASGASPAHQVRSSEINARLPSIGKESRAGPSSGPGHAEMLLKQPQTRPITEQQLIKEVKGIYAGLVMVEKKCVELVAQQTSTKRLEPQQWKALVALHRTLLQEHHDFFSTAQHPTASDALQRLAAKHTMPARMWRHGIHAFLELLRHRLPDSMEHMLSFIYLSYSMMALLKESVPSFVETWIECLGDLARYRMAIEDSDLRDREIWSNVARTWYNEAADKSPNVGRIQHHLAVLARPNVVEQLFYYTKALTTVILFINARESIILLFDTFLKSKETTQARYPSTESSLVQGFSILFVRGPGRTFYELREQYLSSFNAHIDRSRAKLKVQGPQVALALIAGLLDAGKDDTLLIRSRLGKKMRDLQTASRIGVWHAPAEPNTTSPNKVSHNDAETHRISEASTKSDGVEILAGSRKFIGRLRTSLRGFQNRFWYEIMLLWLVFEHFPLTNALPTAAVQGDKDPSIPGIAKGLIPTDLSWGLLVLPAASIPYFGPLLQLEDPIFTSGCSSYIFSVLTIVAYDPDTSIIAKGFIQGLWLGFTTWFYAATTSREKRTLVHITKHFVLFCGFYQAFSSSRMGDSTVKPALAPSIPYISACLSIASYTLLGVWIDRFTRLCTRLVNALRG